MTLQQDNNLSFNVLCETRSPKDMQQSVLAAQSQCPNCDGEMHWFAMRATYHREFSVRALLEAAGIECYLPTTQQLKQINGRKLRITIPLIASLIFVHCVKEKLQHFKARVPHLQYMTKREGAKNIPIIVPQKQMDDFIAVTRSYTEQTLFFKPGELNFKCGTRVRLHGGILDGLEGILMKVTGKRNRRVVIEVEDVIAVAIECTDAQFIEIIQ